MPEGLSTCIMVSVKSFVCHAETLLHFLHFSLALPGWSSLAFSPFLSFLLVFLFLFPFSFLSTLRLLQI